jgi:hypothetical protein
MMANSSELKITIDFPDIIVLGLNSNSVVNCIEIFKEVDVKQRHYVDEIIENNNC